MISLHDTPHVRPDKCPALSLLVIGDAADRTGCIDAIRALALVKRFVDRLTLVGYGRHRRSLEKWATALQVDHLIVFDEPSACALIGEDEVVIRFVRHPAAITVTAPGLPPVGVARGDRIALANALIAWRAAARLPAAISPPRLNSVATI